MAEPEVVVLSMGMMTAVGLDALQTAAAVRAGMMRFTESIWLDAALEPYMMAQVIEDALPEAAPDPEEAKLPSARETRLLRLAAPALLECLRPLAQVEEDIGVFVALPEISSRTALQPITFLRRLALQTAEAFAPGLSEASFTGRAGGLRAIDAARRRIRQGEAAFAVAGGVDSFRDFFVLKRLEHDERAKSTYVQDGFVPGEGAAFVLLGERARAQALGLPILGRVSEVALGQEPGHLSSDLPYRGEGLAAAIATLIAQAGLSEPIREVYSSMNGENYWAKEWGVAFLRNRSGFDPEHGMHHPADSYGDVGAASGPLMVALSLMGMHQGYRQAPALVYGSSDLGERAALIVQSR